MDDEVAVAARTGVAQVSEIACYELVGDTR